MIRLNWHDQPLRVGRLVYRNESELTFGATLDRLAALLRLDVADDRAEPRPGDFWIGCHPRTGWGGADPEQIGWASLVDVPQAIGVLNRCAALGGAAGEMIPDPWPAFAVALG
jgi:hypothetical protein